MEFAQGPSPVTPDSRVARWDSKGVEFESGSTLLFVATCLILGGGQLVEDASGTSLVVQWLRRHASTAGNGGSIPGQGSLMLCSAARKKKRSLPVWPLLGAVPDHLHVTFYPMFTLKPEDKSP